MGSDSVVSHMISNTTVVGGGGGGGGGGRDLVRPKAKRFLLQPLASFRSSSIRAFTGAPFQKTQLCFSWFCCSATCDTPAVLLLKRQRQPLVRNWTSYKREFPNATRSGEMALSCWGAQRRRPWD